MDQNNPLPANNCGGSGQFFYGGQYYDPRAMAPHPSFWRPPPQFCHFQPRGFPFHPVGPYRYGPPMFRPPGPPPSSFSESVSVPSTEDKIWLTNWLQSRSLHQPKSTPTDIGTTIHEARDKLKLWLELLKELKEKHDELRENKSALSREEWETSLAEVSKKKFVISDLESKYFGEKALEGLQKRLLKRMRKRTRQKSQSAKLKRDAYEAQLRRQSLHLRADAWLADMQLAVERARKDEELKKEADAVLAEVTRRQSDGRRQMALIEALVKLHSARIQTMEARGSKLSAEDKKNADNSVLIFGKLQALWSKKMDEYSKEEHGLRVMLQESAAKQSDQEIEKVRSILQEWERCLFGSECPAVMDEPSDLDAFVSIRYGWDQYLVAGGSALPMASSMPVGWVLPTTPSSPGWQMLLVKE